MGGSGSFIWPGIRLSARVIVVSFRGPADGSRPRQCCTDLEPGPAYRRDALIATGVNAARWPTSPVWTLPAVYQVMRLGRQRHTRSGTPRPPATAIGQGGGPGGGWGGGASPLAAVAELAAAAAAAKAAAVTEVAAATVWRVAAEAVMELTGWSGSPTRCWVRMSHVSLGTGAAGDLDPARADRARAAVRPPARHLGRRLRGPKSERRYRGSGTGAGGVPHVLGLTDWSMTRRWLRRRAPRGDRGREPGGVGSRRAGPGRAHRAAVRPLRRTAAAGRGRLAYAAVRADRGGRPLVRARHGRLQGQHRHAPDRAARARGRRAGQPEAGRGGSEEQGTGGLEAFVPGDADLLRADAILVCDTGNAAVGYGRSR